MQGIEDRNMRKYHHIGIPTAVQRPRETYLDRYDVYCTDDASSSFGIQWMRYRPRCDLPELVKTIAHVAFEVDDLDAEIAGHEVLIAPNSPSPGVIVAFIKESGAPIELLQFIGKNSVASAAGNTPQSTG
jgi:hypothetical protein